jgi:TonB family protein
LNDGTVKPPAKTRHVNPVYPQSAIREQRGGIAILELTVGASGCVGRAEVLRSIGPDLDLAALRAVTGWAFKPTIVDGRAVALIMTVTVQFTLTR